MRIKRCFTKLFMSISIALAATTLFIPHDTVFAWWMGEKNIHLYLTMLSSPELENNGLMDTVQLRLGADDPDIGKRVDHASTSRTVNAFNAAITAYERGKPEESIRRLGRAFHYIKDNGDVTDIFANKILFIEKTTGRKIYLRKLAYQVLTEYERVGFSKIRKTDRWQKKYRSAIIRVRSMSIAQMVRELREQSEEVAKSLAEYYKQYHSGNLRERKRDELIKEELKKIFAFITACQNRTIEIFMEKTDQTQFRGNQCSKPKMARLIGTWTFGRRKAPQGIPTGVLCKIKLTPRQGNYGAYVLEACHPNLDSHVSFLN